MPDLNGDPAVTLAVTFSLAVGRLARELAARKLPGLTAPEAAVLHDLENGPATPAELASLERMRPPSMTRHITGLEARGLLSRKPHPSDRRQVVLALTNSGRDALALADDGSWLAGRVRELAPGERDALQAAVPVIIRLGTVCAANDP